MSSLIDYKGFQIVSPDPSNLGGSALNSNFKRMGDLFTGSSATFYVDNTRSETFTPDGTFYRPFKLVQDAIDAVLAFAEASTASIVSVMIQVGPGNYQDGVLTVDLPTKPLRLSIRGAGSGGCDGTLVGPINFNLPDSASSNTMIAIADITFVSSAASRADTAFKIADGTNTGYTLFYFFNTQCWADQAATYALHVTNGGGNGFLLLQCDGHCLIKSTETTSDPDDAVTALRLERGQFTAVAAHLYSLRAPTIILSGTASLNLSSSYCQVDLGTAGAKNVDCIQASDTANIQIQLSTLIPTGNGQVVSHSGTFDGTNGYVILDDVGAVLSGGTGGIYLPAGALLFASQIVSETGAPLPVTVASPALRVFIQRDANIGFTPANPSDWATSPPVNIMDAINRIAAAVVALQGGPIS